MKAIVQDRYGPPQEVLRLVEIDRPVVVGAEVLVRVRAAAVNPADWSYTTGIPYFARAAYGLRGPKEQVRGTDVAGVVEAVGPEVKALEPGDEVFGAGRRAFAEFALAPERNLVLKPAGVSWEAAGATPMAGLVALQAIRDKGRIQAGQKVLVNGAGGGVGTFAVQMARIFGAEVTAVCSPAKVELVRSLGVDRVLDYTRDDFTRGNERYDLILDNASNRPLLAIRRVLAPEGVLIVNAGEFGHRVVGPMGRFLRASLISPFGPGKLINFLSRPNQADLLALREFLGTGRLQPVIGRTFRLEQAPPAVAYVGEGHAAGKVVITG